MEERDLTKKSQESGQEGEDAQEPLKEVEGTESPTREAEDTPISPSRWISICTDCLRIDRFSVDQHCQSPLVPVCDPEGNQKIIAGFIRMLEGGKSPFQLLREACRGISRYPRDFSYPSHKAWLACRQHHGYSIWLWSMPFSNILGIDSMSKTKVMNETQENQDIERAWRALSETSLLLIEAPQNTASFRVRYAQENSELMHFPQMLSHLGGVVEYLGTKFSAIGIIGQQEKIERLQEGIDQIKLWPGSPEVTVFPNESEAVKSFISQVTKYFPSYLPHSHPLIISAPSPTPTTPLKNDLVWIMDIGGEVGRDLLSQMHKQALDAIDAGEINSRTSIVSLPHQKIFKRIKLLGALPSAAGLEWGKIQSVRQWMSPGPMDEVPAWEGVFKRGIWGRVLHVKFELLTGEVPPLPGVIIAGIGTDRLRGEYQLARLLEWSWKTGSSEFIFLRRKDSDSKIERWVNDTFGITSIYDLDQDLMVPVHAAVALLYNT